MKRVRKDVALQNRCRVTTSFHEGAEQSNKKGQRNKYREHEQWNEHGS